MITIFTQSVRPSVRPKTLKSSDNHCRPGLWAGRVDHWWLLSCSWYFLPIWLSFQSNAIAKQALFKKSISQIFPKCMRLCNIIVRFVETSLYFYICAKVDLFSFSLLTFAWVADLRPISIERKSMPSHVVVEVSSTKENCRVAMIHSARPTFSPVVNIVFAWNLFCFEKFWKNVCMYGRTTCAKTIITTGRDCESAEWIKK